MDDKLRLHVEALETLIEEKKNLSDAIKDRKALAKSDGFDTKVLDAVIARRAKERAAVEEFDQLVETYEAKLGVH